MSSIFKYALFLSMEDIKSLNGEFRRRNGLAESAEAKDATPVTTLERCMRQV
jgi:hypothetical protein